MPAPKIATTLKKFVNEYIYISIQTLTDLDDVEITVKAKGNGKKTEDDLDEDGSKLMSKGQSLATFMLNTNEKINKILEDP